MRLNRLELIRYGRFQDYALDFWAGGGGPAGRRGRLRRQRGGEEHGVLGVARLPARLPGRVAYAFRFERRDLMVGAELRDADRPCSRRSTAAAGSLTDANGHLVADQRRRPAGSTGWTEAYRTRFSLNDLSSGRRQGDRPGAGRPRPAAACRRLGPRRALERAGGDRGEVTAFHKKGGRKTVANEGRNWAEGAGGPASHRPARPAKLRPAGQLTAATPTPPSPRPPAISPTPGAP